MEDTTEDEIQTAPEKKLSLPVMVGCTIALIGLTCGIMAWVKTQKPRLEIKKYKTRGRIQKPRKHYRKLRQREQRIQKAIKKENLENGISK